MKPKLTNGKGWHQESMRHSNARKFGSAGSIAITQPETLQSGFITPTTNRPWHMKHMAGRTTKRIKEVGVGHGIVEPNINIGAGRNFEFEMPKNSLLPVEKQKELKKIFTNSDDYPKLFYQKGIRQGQPRYQDIAAKVGTGRKTVMRWGSARNRESVRASERRRYPIRIKKPQYQFIARRAYERRMIDPVFKAKASAVSAKYREDNRSKHLPKHAKSEQRRRGRIKALQGLKSLF